MWGLLIASIVLGPVNPCGDILIVVEHSEYLDENSYSRIEEFWKERIPGLSLRITEQQVPAATTIRVYNLTMFTYQDAYAGFDRFTARTQTSEKGCYSTSSIRLFKGYDLLPQDMRELILAHEIGHGLGLPHRDNTLMGDAETSTWDLDAFQLAALNERYTKPQP